MFSPKIDEHGNSVRGLKIFENLARDMGLHLMEGTPSAQTILQSRYTVGKKNNVVVYELRGVLQFTESEMLLRILQDEPAGKSTIVLDLTNLSLIHDVGVRMLFEGVDRLKQDGHKVVVVDSEGLLDKEQLKGRKRDVVTEELEKFLERFK